MRSFDGQRASFTEKPRLPTFRTERSRLAQLADGALIAGIDEAGIGPWAGPVVAAAVCLNPKSIPKGLADSKILTARRRQELFAQIMANAEVGVGIADVDRIDRDNVLAANHWAMRQAVAALPRHPALALIDGVHAPDVGCPREAIVNGDARIVSIAAASIIAKVTRDRIMAELALQYPGYGFERHKGYGTAAHGKAIASLGVTNIHRRSFKPIQVALKQAGR